MLSCIWKIFQTLNSSGITKTAAVTAQVFELNTEKYEWYVKHRSYKHIYDECQVEKVNGTIEYIFQLSEFEPSEVDLVVRHGSIHRTNSDPSTGMNSEDDQSDGQPESINNEGSHGSEVTNAFDTTDGSDTLNQSENSNNAELPPAPLTCFPTPLAPGQSGGTWTSGLKGDFCDEHLNSSVETPTSTSTLDRSLSMTDSSNDSPLSSEGISFIHMEAEAETEQIIDEYRSATQLSQASSNQGEISPFSASYEASDNAPSSWLWELINDDQFDQLISDDNGRNFIRNFAGGNEEHLDALIQEMEIQLENQGHPDEIFAPFEAIHNPGLSPVLSPEFRPGEGLGSQTSEDTHIVPDNNLDNASLLSNETRSTAENVTVGIDNHRILSQGESSISSRERDFRNFGDRFGSEHVHEYGMYPDAYLGYSSSQDLSPSYYDPPASPRDVSEASYPDTDEEALDEVRVILRHNMSQITQTHPIIDLEQGVVPNQQEDEIEGYVNRIREIRSRRPNSSLRAHGCSSERTPGIRIRYEPGRDLRDPIRTSWPENEIDESELAANLEFLETELLQENLTYNLTLFHTRSEIESDRVIQEFQEDWEAGGRLEDNPDLLIPEIDASQIVAAGIWENFLIEQEFLLNPEGFPTDIGNSYGNFIDIEDDLGIEVDRIHALAASEETDLVKDFELSQMVYNKKPP